MKPVHKSVNTMSEAEFLNFCRFYNLEAILGQNNGKFFENRQNMNFKDP